MTLTQALQIVFQTDTNRAWDDEEWRQVVAMHDAIRTSGGYRLIVQTSLETVDEFGIRGSLEAAVGMGIRFGIQVVQLYQSANDNKGSADAGNREERQNKKEPEERKEP